MSKYNRFEKHRLKRQNKKEKRSKRKKIFKIGILVILLAAVVSVGVFVVMQKGQVKPKKELLIDQKLNLLVSGVDALQKGANRSDFIAVVSLDLESGNIGVLSLPRDTRVKIPGEEGYHKLNSAYAYGGIELLKETVKNNFKVPIDYYINTDFIGFKDIINTLGGVEVDVEKDLKYIDQAGGLYIDIPAGKQVLNGQEALEYIRFRHDKLGDIGRIQRQQKFLKAVVDKVSTPKIILKLPKLSKHLFDNIETDVPLTKGFKLATNLAGMFKNMNKDKIKMKTLPGEPRYIDGISYWVPNRWKSEAVIAKLIRSKEYLANSKLKIVVLNGSGQKGVANQIGDILSQSGYKVVKIGNANGFNYSRTQILFRPEFESEAKSLADYLDGKAITWENINSNLDAQNKVDIKIILGKNLNGS
ncbi:LCP family protein [Selenihalanaerobacter shriftii]|nr:LCP family protein [Selenihalanaerobacter shriftii]